MYRVLLADDEPLILSGLQSMLPWESLGCTVAGAVRNGVQALEVLEAQRPDIVICDITMPLMNGLELLAQAAERYPETVFVMLTNHGQFDLAQEALRGRAVDYLLKIDLDEQKLEQAVHRAIREREKRRSLTAAQADALPAGEDMLSSLVDALLSGRGETAAAAAAELQQRGMTERCGLAEILLDPAQIPSIATFSPEERRRLFDFHHKLVDDMARRLFFAGGYLLFPRRQDQLLLFVWGLESGDIFTRFQLKLASVLGNISQMQARLLATEIVGDGDLSALRRQLLCLEAEFSLSPRAVIQYSQSMSKTDYVDAAKQYVERHILERISVQDAAAAIGITPNYLSSLFKRQLGQNFMDFVNKAKVEYACSLLQHNGHLVYEVSHMLGYDNAYYFSKVFKRYTGMTPTEYQNRG